MIVTCERCSTQFQLDDTRVPKRGVNVRCSRCKHAFRVVPESERAAEAAAAAQSARGDTDTREITQDVPQSPGDSRSQSGERRRAREARSAQPRANAESSLGASGSESEESDWRFNDDRENRGASAPNLEEKPEPPEAPAPSRNSRLGNEWFGGGADDLPLELDDRPRNPEPEPPEPEAPVVAARAALEPAPAFEPIPTPAPTPALATEPEPVAAEPSFDTSFEGDLGSLTSRDSDADRSTPQPDRRAASESSDELSGDAWDLLAAAAEESPSQTQAEPRAVAAPRGPRFQFRLRLGDMVARVVEWVGHVGTAFGWAAALALFGYGLYSGLAPVHAAEPTTERAGPLEISALTSRSLENMSQGTLWVVSGRLSNPGPGDVDLASLALVMLDRRGEPLAVERVPLHAPFAREQLREAPALEAPPLAGMVRPGEQRSFEAVMTALPPDAVSFRVVADGPRRAR